MPDANYQPPDGYVTLMQAMTQLGVSRATVQRMAQDGRLPTYRDQRDKRVRLAKVEDVERLSRPASPSTSSSASCEDAMSSRYTVLIYPDEGAYSVTVPALPGCVTWGATLDEAVSSARDAIEGHVAALRDTGQEVPEEDASPIVLTVDLAEREPARA